MVRLPNAVLLGSLSNDDGNGDEEAKKATQKQVLVFAIPQKLETVRILFINTVAPRNARPQGFFDLLGRYRKKGHSPLVTAG